MNTERELGRMEYIPEWQLMFIRSMFHIAELGPDKTVIATQDMLDLVGVYYFKLPEPANDQIVLR